MRLEKSRKIIQASKKIHGWFTPEAALLFAWIDEIQKSNDIIGDMFEIGCHHGKSTLCLGAMVRPEKEKISVCDLFGNQDANISGSGSGDLDIFSRNMAPIKESGVKISIFQAKSNTLTPDDIGNKYRFFHIDGGHNCEEALSDLNLAAKCVVEKGVIAVDDPFRPEWPGVTEAIIRFLDSNAQYCAIIVGFNKLFITRREYASIYLREIRQKEKRNKHGLGYPWYTKVLPFHGHPLEIFYVPTYVPMTGPGFVLTRWYYNHGQVMRPVVHAMKNLQRRH